MESMVLRAESDSFSSPGTPCRWNWLMQLIKYFLLVRLDMLQPAQHPTQPVTTRGTAQHSPKLIDFGPQPGSDLGGWLGPRSWISMESMVLRAESDSFSSPGTPCRWNWLMQLIKYFLLVRLDMLQPAQHPTQPVTTRGTAQHSPKLGFSVDTCWIATGAMLGPTVYPGSGPI